MGAGDFRGDAGRLEGQIEEMAHVMYGLPKNEVSKTVARNVAALLLTLSSVKFEKEEEPIRPRPPEGRRADG
ncbi:MAG TPA: hypothetical protein DDZ83_11565 [Nitrospinae bacterium]|nr:hypothetical protein [Nitrospinota bacterium]